MYSDAPKALAEKILGWTAEAIQDDQIVVPIGRYPTRSDEPGGRFLQPSFVVDFDEPPVVEVFQAAKAELGLSPTISDLERFVAGWITDNELGRGRDIASQVARNRAGDCTEHSVLLAALARSFGQPARLVGGLVVVVKDGKAAAYGHAWVEIHDGKQWQLADSALRKTRPIFYVPTSGVGDEGPGYASLLAAKFGKGNVTRVEILGASIEVNAR